ncbi:MAG: hypothetical protein Q9178_004431 [Gyalolechia marmorata]
MFKRSRSKSEKLTTPPKIVFGDLNAAYKSIAQKTTPNSPEEHSKPHGKPSGHIETNSPWSPAQSPQLQVSSSAALLRSPPPDTIRISHLSEDLFLPRNFDSPEPYFKPQITWDPFDSSSHHRTSNHHRTSVTTLEVQTNILDGYFGVTSSNVIKSRQEQEQEQDQSRQQTSILDASDWPELGDAQLQACAILSGAEMPNEGSANDLARCGTIRSVVTRHPYGRVDTNEDIRSIHGSNEEDRTDKGSENPQRDEIEEVEWSPRSSIEIHATSSIAIRGQNHPGAPPSMSLPRTPKGKDTVPYQFGDPTSPSEEVSHSSESYGNTQRLLQLSMPQLPEAPVPRANLYHQLVQFAREGQSSSSQGNSSMSFAEFSIEAAHGAQITRPITQGEFQVLQRTISSHRRYESGLSEEAADGSLVRVGRISLLFPGTSSEVDSGPGRSQTTSAESDVEVNWETGSVRVPLRTRNGTPSLLFGNFDCSRCENDWETVREGTGMTSSLADVSDSEDRSPTEGFPSLRPTEVLRRPRHPRYNHSWDLQQDIRSGAFVLTPRYEELRTDNYSHPTPLTASHNHPFEAPPVKISPAESARPIDLAQHTEIGHARNQVQSQGSSAWLSTAGGSLPYMPTTVAGAGNPSVTAPIPPVPRKNPSRRWKQRLSKEPLDRSRGFNFGFHSDRSMIDEVSAMEEGITPVVAGSPTLALTPGLDSPTISVPLRSPLRHLKGKHPFISVISIDYTEIKYLTAAPAKATKQRPQNQSASQDHLLNPFSDSINHEGSIASSASPPINRSASTLAFPENAFTPNHRSRMARPSSSFITPDCSPTAIKLQPIISPFARARMAPIPNPTPTPTRPLSHPRLWKPTPHPLAHLGPRETSPHLYHQRRWKTPLRQQNKQPSSHQQVLSRYYLLACAVFPVLLAVYFLGGLDWAMRVHTGGVCRGMAGREKRLAGLVFAVEVLGLVAFVPLVLSVV